jgi:hypothetical protein
MKKYAIPPITTPEFTKGLEYEIIKMDKVDLRFFTRNNKGEIMCLNAKESEAIDFNDWQIIEK